MFKENNQRLRFLTEVEIDLSASSVRSEPILRPIGGNGPAFRYEAGELLSLKWEQIRNGFIYLDGDQKRQGPANPY